MRDPNPTARERAAAAMARGARLREDERLQGGRHAAEDRDDEPVSLSELQLSVLRWARDHANVTTALSVAGAFDLDALAAARVLTDLASVGLFRPVTPAVETPAGYRRRLTFAGKLVADMSRGSES